MRLLASARGRGRGRRSGRRRPRARARRPRRTRSPGRAVTTPPVVTIVGAGLAGSECALALARAGVRVVLLEQKPVARTPAQSSDSFCELVSSNSFRGASLANAVGLLKEEMRRLGSQVMATAEETRVPAGGGAGGGGAGVFVRGRRH